MDFKKIRLLLLIYTLAIAIISLGLATLDVWDIKRQDKTPQIRAAMLASEPADLRLCSKEILMTKAWVFMTDNSDAEGVPVPEFSSWRCDDLNFSSFCQFGFKLLVLWARNHDIQNLLIAEDIVRRSLATFDKFEFLPRMPWGENWYAFSVQLSRLLAMYIYLGDKEEIKKRCYKLIMRLVTKLDRSLSMERDGLNVAYLGIPRLCATYRYNREIFDQETRDVENPFLKLTDLFLITYNKSPAIFNGVYEDGSCIEHSDVATYSYFVTLDEFYDPVYHALDLPSNIREIAHKMLGKIIHPDIPWLPFGLFGRHGGRFRNKRWWDVPGSRAGIELMPFSGLAIFKSRGFMISARVQRPKITAYETDLKAKGEFALAWIQLRRIYVKGGHYEPTLTWEILKSEPGMLVPLDGEFQQLLGGSGRTTASFYCKEGSIDSFIGRLVDSELLFWKNKYNFVHAYGGDCYVTEAAVVTHHGLEAFYRIENQSSRDLKFIWKDNVNKLAINDVTGEYQDNSVVVPSGTTKEFNWRMLVDEGPRKNVRLDEGILIFEHQDKKYQVKTLKENEKFLVLREVIPLLIGTSSSVPDDAVEFDNKIYRRDPKTLMYELKD